LKKSISLCEEWFGKSLLKMQIYNLLSNTLEKIYLENLSFEGEMRRDELKDCKGYKSDSTMVSSLGCVW
jgi:hypothetical protein